MIRVTITVSDPEGEITSNMMVEGGASSSHLGMLIGKAINGVAPQLRPDGSIMDMIRESCANQFALDGKPTKYVQEAK